MMTDKIKDISGREWNKIFISSIIDVMNEKQAKDALQDMLLNDSSLLGAISRALYGHHRGFE